MTNFTIQVRVSAQSVWAGKEKTLQASVRRFLKKLGLVVEYIDVIESKK